MTVDEAGVEAVAGADRVDGGGAQGAGAHDGDAVERAGALRAALHDGTLPQRSERLQHAPEVGRLGRPGRTGRAGRVGPERPLRLGRLLSAGVRRNLSPAEARGHRQGLVEVRQVEIGLAQHLAQAALPAALPVALRVERGRAAGPADLGEEVCEVGREPGQQVERAHVQVARPLRVRAAHHRRRELADAAQRGEHGAVALGARSHEVHGEPGGPTRQHDAAGDVDAAGRELFEHETARGVVAEHPDEGDAQSQPCRPASHDRRRAADRQRAARNERLGLTEGDLAGDVADDDVGHGVAGDQQVDLAGAVGRPGSAAGVKRISGGGHLNRSS